MTIGELIPMYLRNHVVLLKNRMGTEQIFAKYVAQFAGKELGHVTKLDVLDWFHRITANVGPMAANNALIQLSALYTRAMEWEVYEGRNPAKGIKRNPKRSRERFIQQHEMPYLLASIEEEIPRTAAYFLMLLFTGARRDEARRARWVDLDLVGGLWHKPMTKNGRTHTVPLPQRLLVRLCALPRTHEWVFPSTPNNKRSESGEWGRTCVEHAWRKIRARVGLNDVRIHDLRRTAASWLAISGENLPVIQRTLNHSSLTATQVYARLDITPVRRALDQQAERMMQTLTPLPIPEEARPHEWPG